MHKSLSVLTLLSLAACCTVSCRHEAAKEWGGLNNTRFDSLGNEAVRFIYAGEPGRCDSVARILEKEARLAGDDRALGYALMLQGWYMDDPAQVEHRLSKLREAEKVLSATDNDSLLSMVYNIQGIYMSNQDGSLSEARRLFNLAIDHAKRTPAHDFVISAECNLSSIYHFIGDTLGIVYDLDIYEFAAKNGNIGLLENAARNCAEYYIDNHTDHQQAVPYIERIGECGNDALENALWAKYFAACGNLDQAVAKIEEPLTKHAPRRYYYLTQAQIYNLAGRWADSNHSLDLCNKADDTEDLLSDHRNIEAERLRAVNYRHLGQEGKALNHYERYINMRDSVAAIRSTEEINAFKIKYDTEKKELALATQRERSRRQLAILLGLLGICLAVIVLMVVLNVRRRNMQRLIVRKEQDFDMRRRTIVDLMTPPAVADASTQTETAEEKEQIEGLPQGLSAARAETIWRRILQLMEEEKIYADPTVTRETFAERTGCNHTWFSSVIKLKTGRSYSQFMSVWRIERAVQILSSREGNVSGKQLAQDLGFLTAPTFYAAFRRHMGMSPGDYRKRIEEQWLAESQQGEED